MPKHVAVDAQSVEGRIPGAAPTEESLRREAEAMGDTFSDSKGHPADLVADAKEMIAFRKDAKDLASRGYSVTDGMFVRMVLLAGLITGLSMKQRETGVSSMKKTARAEQARVRLLKIRETFSRIGVAAGLDAKLFSLRTNQTQRLSVVIMNMSGVITLMEKHKATLPDRVKVEALIAEAKGLISTNDELKNQGASERGGRVGESLFIAQLCRMLLDVMQHLSHQGLAAYEGDLMRLPAYRLDHTYSKRTKRAVLEAPAPA